MKNFVNFVKVLFKANLFSYSAQVAFYALLALFPFLFLLISLTSYLPLTEADILNGVALLFPQIASNVIISNIQTLTAGGASPVMWFFYILLALWSSSMLINSIKVAFLDYYGKSESASFIYLRLFSIVMTVIIALLIIFSLFASLALNIITGYLAAFLHIGNLSRALSAVITFCIAVFDLTLIYRYLPPEKIKLKNALPGAIFASAGVVLASFLFTVYINNFGNFTRLHGALSSVIVLIIWLFICATLIITGGILNSFLIKINKISNTP